MQISDASKPLGVAWLRLGFRPFFLAAGAGGVLLMLAWFAAYTLHLNLPFAGLGPLTWHAHEMIYGYSLAVAAGFLLTAVGNWTGKPTIKGVPLLLLLLCWLVPRLLMSTGHAALLPLAAVLDLLFLSLFTLVITLPIVRARQWHNLSIVIKLVLLVVSNLAFYLGVSGYLQQGINWGLYSGLYLVMALIFMLSRRVLPFFIEKGVGYPVTLRNSRFVDIASLVLFVAFWIADLAVPNGLLVALLAAGLFVLHLWRWWGWHTPGIWRQPLLWSLYLAYAAYIAGFGLKAALYVTGLSPFLALHAFAVGGIGLTTLGMMARISLGHTGRNVFEPPAALPWAFLLLTAGVLVRVLLPMLFADRYELWIALSQGLWVAAFLVFLLLYVPILTQPRVDGQDG